MYWLECIECESRFQPNEVIYTCSRCGGLLTVKYEYESLSRVVRDKWRERKLVDLWKYRELLPVEGRIVSLGEGATKLYECSRLREELLNGEVFVKFEGGNPTGSFKDRGMTVGVSKALELGMKSVMCASTGNTSASLSAYAAKAGLKCFVLIPSGKVALGKIAQAIIHGARVIQIKGNFDEALRIVREISSRHRVYLLNSINPFRLEGQKTIAYEVWEQLDWSPPDNVVVPVGNAGNISAIWKGFKELSEMDLVDRLPRMIGVQAEGANPIYMAYKRGLDSIEFIDSPETIATAIRIGRPVNWRKAVNAIKESNGLVEQVSDEEILEAQRMLASLEGLFVEPASASTIAALSKLYERGVISESERTVCIATGHGLKDPSIVVERYKDKIFEVKAVVEEIVKVMGLSS